MSEILKNKDITINHIRNLKAQGAVMTEAIAAAGADAPPTAGIFADEWEEWTADNSLIPAKSLRQYKGTGYQARTDIYAYEAYAPDLAVNNWAVRPKPDEKGVYPAAINMDVSIGMLLRDAEDGLVYECYANPVASLQAQPHELPASFRLYAEGDGA